MNADIIILIIKIKSSHSNVQHYNTAMAIKDACKFILRHLKVDDSDDLKEPIKKLGVII